MKKLKIESNFHNPVIFLLKDVYKALFDPHYADSAFLWDSVNRHTTMRAYSYGETKNPKPAQKIILKVMACGHNEEA